MSNAIDNTRHTFGCLLKKYDRIVIPRIQRDYAQGRDNRKAKDIRNQILNCIFSQESVDFDLIYGSSVEKMNRDGITVNCFIPIDGQQRLTTLFLLYLYGNKNKRFYVEGLDKFTYETRRAAQDFCKAIVDNDWNNPNVIKDAIWFMNYWKKDPTVAAMLNMLCDIHEKAEKSHEYPDLEKVTFILFDMDKYNQTDDLYLKMNSRGKPLTPFENLKANIDDLLQLRGERITCVWRHNIDRSWQDAFWDKNHPERLDNNILLFILRFLAGYNSYLIGDVEDDRLKPLCGDRKDDDYVPFEPVKEVLCTDGAIISLAKALRHISRQSEYFKPSWDAERSVSGNSEYKFVALALSYAILGDKGDSKRFAHNMAENYVENYETLVSYCKTLRDITDKKSRCGDLYKSIIQLTTQQAQLSEEIEKAKLIVQGKSWREKIEGAEDYSFFHGSIRFLFQDEEGKTDWTFFDKKWDAVQRFFAEDEDQSSVMNKGYHNTELLKTLFSRFTIENFRDKLWWHYRAFNNKAHTWMYYLLSPDLSSPVHHLLLGHPRSPQWQQDSQDDFAKHILYLLTHTKLLDYVENKISGSWIRDHLGHKAIYPSSTGVFLDAFVRDEFLLNSDGIQVDDSAKIPGTSLLYGWNINFRYKQHNFQWYHTDYVYLMDSNDGNVYVENDVEGMTEEEKFFCFKCADSMLKEDILSQLDELIVKACPFKAESNEELSV